MSLERRRRTRKSNLETGTRKMKTNVTLLGVLRQEEGKAVTILHEDRRL